MTRINSAISPKNLTDQHLIAELRELSRIFVAVKKLLNKGVMHEKRPTEFCLGTGHCLFFYDKCQFLYVRHSNLRIEYCFRFNKEYSFKIENLDWLPNNLYKGYDPTEQEKQLLIERISTRITESKQIPRYYGKTITKEQAIQILKS